MDVRKNIKDLDSSELVRLLEAFKWLKLHNHDGTNNTTGGMYQKFVNWHANDTAIALAKLNNYSLAVTDPFTATDTLTQMRIDGKNIVLPLPAPTLNNPSSIQINLNALVSHGDPASFAIFSASSAAANFQLRCNNSPFLIESVSLTVGGVSRTINFTKGPDLGDFELSIPNIAHGNPLFLPWHRVFIRFLELDLQHADRQRGNNGEIALPYWNWDSDRSESWKLWSNDILGPFTNEADGRITSGYFRAKNAVPVGDWIIYEETGGVTSEAAHNYLKRHPIGNVSNMAPGNIVDTLITINDYDLPSYDTSNHFRTQLENIHGLVHVWVGGNTITGSPVGQMSAVNLSPNDPTFFLHHCNVDRIWSRWQREHRRSLQYPEFGLFPGHRKTDLMEPWKSLPVTDAYKMNVRAADVLNWQNFDAVVHPKLGSGYKYDCESSITLSTP